MSTQLAKDFMWSALVPELLVTDIQVSLKFWCGYLGFNVAYERQGDQFAYIELEKAQVMLEQIDCNHADWHTSELENPLGRGINFQIEVDALEPTIERLAAANWPLFQPPEEKWYRAGQLQVGQREFLLQDPDGYLIRLCCSLGRRELNPKDGAQT